MTMNKLMLDQPSIRSTVRIEWSAEKNRILHNYKPVWSEVVTVERRAKDGHIEQLRYKMGVCQERWGSQDISISIYLLQGKRVSLNWRFRQDSFEFSGVNKVKSLDSGTVLEHSQTARFSDKGCSYFEGQLDILAEVDQNETLGELENGFIADFGNLLASRELTDLVLACGDRQFPCHRLVLACRSNVFKAMLFSQEDFKEKKEGKVVINDFRPEEVEQFIKFVYGGKCDFGKANLWSLLVMADMYNIEALTKCCSRALQDLLDNDNCMEYLNLASKFRVEELVRSALDLALDGGNVVISDSDWDDWAKQYPEMVKVLAEKARQQTV